jgi:ABC-type branched-subunit amino acid transport system ATPase component
MPDEPSTEVNQQERQEIETLLWKLNDNGSAQALIEHDFTGNTSLDINFGRFIAEETPESVS